MKKMTIVLLALGMTGCQSTGPVKRTASTALTDAEQGIHICRPPSYIRAIEAPNLYINDEDSGELKNGSEISARIKAGDRVYLGTKANIFLYRYEDEELMRRTILDQSSVYVLVEARPDLAFGFTSLFIGAAPATFITESDRWRSAVVDKKTYIEKCPKE